MIWQTGNPTAEGMYLCAFPKGDGYVYSLQLWKDKAWWYGMTATPYAWAEIDSPQKQEDMLDELYKADEKRT